MRIFLYIGLFFAVSFLSVSVLHAQILGSLESVEISLSPQYPQPGQAVTATVSSTSENVRSATIAWLLNDEIQQQEAGGDTFTFTATTIGTSQTLGVLVKSADGQVLVKTITLEPSEVTLLWEARTYTPPFYKGRALYSSGSTILAEAIPNFRNKQGELIPASELLYTWSKNGTVLGSESGIGASFLTTEGPKFFGSYILLVEVTTQEGTQVARSAARIETNDPIIKLYEHDPLTGIQYHDAISTNHDFFGASQFTVQAAPYFMDIIHENDGFLDYSWHVNNIEVASVDESPSTLNIQLAAEEDITTPIRVAVDHALHLLQSGRTTFNVVFEGSTRNSLFGL